MIFFRFPHLYFKYYLEILRDFFQFSVLGKILNLASDEAVIPSSVQIKAEYDKDSDTYFAEATHLKEIYTSAPSTSQMINNINVQLYEHFYVQRRIYREMGNYYNPPEKALLELEKARAKGRNKRINLSFPAYDMNKQFA